MSEPATPGPRWKWFAWLTAAVAGLSSVIQILGVFIRGFAVLPWSIVVTLLGAGSAIGGEKLWASGLLRKPRAVAVLFLAAVLVAGGGGFALARTIAKAPCHDSTGCPTTPTPSPSAPHPSTSTPSPDPSTVTPALGCPPATSNSATGGRPNRAARHDGVVVYCGPDGTHGPSGIPKIPFWQQVTVTCWTENLSGMSSITAMYRLGAGRWQGLYAVSDLFSNGDPPAGGMTNIDKQLRHC